MAITLKKRSVEGKALTHPQVDNNWATIEDAINAIQARNSASAKSMTVTLVAGDNTVNHALARRARIVQFFLASGEQTDYAWRRDASDPTNKIIITVPAEVPSRELTDSEINIQAF